MKKSMLLITLVVTFLVADKLIPIEETIQRKDQWCWSGCSTPMLNYYGESVSQGEIVEYAYGDSAINQWNWLVGHSAVQYQGKTYYPHGINEIMDNWNTDNEVHYSSLSQSQWKSEVDAGNPFVIRWGWDAGGGHFVVGMGYLSNGNYQVMDPWFGCGYTVQSYNWVATAKGKGNWTHSLTTDRQPPSSEYEVLVAAGSGDGMYKSGETVRIVADEAPEGYIFDKWNGAISKVSGSFDSVATFTMIAEDLVFTALYKSAPVIDTSRLSENFLFIAGWEGIADNYGSQASVDTSKLASDTLISATLKTVKDDAAKEEWAWSQVSISSDTTYDEVNLVKVVYRSEGTLRLSLVQEELSLMGAAYGVVLPKSTSDTTVYVPIDLFTQPSGIADSLKKPLKLETVSALAIELESRDVETSFAISEVRLNGYVEKSVSILGAKGLLQKREIGLSTKGLQLSGFNGGEYLLELFTTNGQLLHHRGLSRVELMQGTVSLPELSNRVFIVRLSNATEVITQKVRY